MNLPELRLLPRFACPSDFFLDVVRARKSRFVMPLFVFPIPFSECGREF
jgi:hypothetical protein